MIVGAHAIIYSTNAEADRKFLANTIGLDNVDAGGGWLIFALPPAELAVHPSENNNVHELYLMCDDMDAFIKDMQEKQVTCAPLSQEPWGHLTSVTLPGGGKLGVYQPLHERPHATD